MDLEMFGTNAPGDLVAIRGTNPRLGDWEHRAFVPKPLSNDMPELDQRTFLIVADARAALAALDSTARQLQNPALLRSPSLRREAQATSALEGTYAPLESVLTVDEDEPSTAELIEIMNYVRAANHAFDWVAEDRPLTVSFLCDLQGLLMSGDPLEDQSGQIRTTQVVIGQRTDPTPNAGTVYNARFIPPPPGDLLNRGFQDLIDWLGTDHRGHIDPIVGAAISHYQFEALHPFRDGNGRIGRLLIVLYFQISNVLHEPTLTVSPWFEARRAEYYDRLLNVSTNNDWDGFVRFFAEGIRASAEATRRKILALVETQNELKETVRHSRLRSDNAHALVDLAVTTPTFTVARVAAELDVSYSRANILVGQLVDLGVLQTIDPSAYKRRFYAPRVIEVLVN